MSRFRYVILPRLLLALSTLALLAALFLLWVTLERPMPTISLACRQAGPANGFSNGEVIASGPIQLNKAQPDDDAWAVLRSGDTYAVAELKRTAGLLWTVPYYELDVLSWMGEHTLYPWYVANTPYSYMDDSKPYGAFPTIRSELIPLAVCTDTSVVRVEGEFLWLGDWEDPQEALAERGVSISWSSAGNGVWVGAPVTSPTPPKPDGRGHSGILSIWCRGYDADGDLVCSYDPTEVE